MCARTHACTLYVRLCVCVCGGGREGVVGPFPGGRGPSEGVVGWQEDCSGGNGGQDGGNRNPLSSRAPKAEFTLRRPIYASDTHLKWGTYQMGAHQGRDRKIPLQALILTSVKNGKNCASLSENLLGSCVVLATCRVSSSASEWPWGSTPRLTWEGAGSNTCSDPRPGGEGTRCLSVMAGVDHFLLVTSSSANSL